MHKFKVKTYEKGPLKVHWDMPKCIHSEKCWRGLGEVFRYNERPWITLDGATQERIVSQIKQCPSGALSYTLEGEEQPSNTDTMEINVLQNGPLILSGKCSVTLPDGSKEDRDGTTALCRCGASANKPYCDGAHNANGFKG
jgi:uncharacterized Fe-S cluster protein YjdI